MSLQPKGFEAYHKIALATTHHPMLPNRLLFIHLQLGFIHCEG